MHDLVRYTTVLLFIVIFWTKNNVDNLARKTFIIHNSHWLRKYDDGKTEWTEIEDLKKMDPGL